MLEVGTVIYDKYRIEELIGQGGMSMVYRASDTHMEEKKWAVKEIKIKSQDKENNEIVENSLLMEEELLKKLDHSALPHIVDIQKNNDTFCIVMEYIEGSSLDKVLEAQGPQPEEKVIKWAKQLCDVLDYLHTHKPPIIYRDMKPDNVMLKSNGNIKIIDLGIATEHKDIDKPDTSLLGTRGYAPPEQYEGMTDARSDIFALGKTMHHLLTGRDPRDAQYSKYVPAKECNPRLSQGISNIIHKCVRPDPKDRYQNCQELLYDLCHVGSMTEIYMKAQKKKLFGFISATVASILCLATGTVCQGMSSRINDNSYDAHVSSQKSDLDDKIADYKQAIEIDPSKTEAYLQMLEAYAEADSFDKRRNEEFLAVYNAHKQDLTGENSDANAVAELNYQIGLLYLNLYKENDSSYSFSTRVQKAFSFFAANYQNNNKLTNFNHQQMSNCYYQICSFYKRFILSSVMSEEASKEEYEALLSECEDTMDIARGAGANDQLSLYNIIFMLLYDQRQSMAQLRIEQDRLLSLLDNIYERSKPEVLFVQKVNAVNMQNEIQNNYATYREAIERAYTNVGAGN